jgi:hypothetical protein
MLITNPQLAKCIALLVDLANLAWDYTRKYTPEGFLLTLSPGWNPQVSTPTFLHPCSYLTDHYWLLMAIVPSFISFYNCSTGHTITRLGHSSRSYLCLAHHQSLAHIKVLLILVSCVVSLIPLATSSGVWHPEIKGKPPSPESCSHPRLLIKDHLQRSMGQGNQPLVPSKAHLPINHANPNTHQHPTVSLQGPPPQASGAAPPQSSTGIAKLKPNRPVQFYLPPPPHYTPSHCLRCAGRRVGWGIKPR